MCPSTSLQSACGTQSGVSAERLAAAVRARDCSSDQERLTVISPRLDAGAYERPASVFSGHRSLDTWPSIVCRDCPPLCLLRLLWLLLPLLRRRDDDVLEVCRRPDGASVASPSLPKVSRTT